MRVISLFDGISTLALALDKVGIPVERYVAYEIEPNAIKISEANYPNIEHRGDVTKADFTEFKGFDLLAGGFPCQSLSITQSKTRQDLNGKSKLFYLVQAEQPLPGVRRKTETAEKRAVKKILLRSVQDQSIS